MQSGPSHLGLLPGTDEGSERVLNACSQWLAAETIGVLRVIVFDESGNPSGGQADVADVTSVGDSASVQTLKAANTSRKSIRIFNNSTAIMYVKYGTSASATDFTKRLVPYADIEETIYRGVITGIWVSDAGGAALVTEMT